MWNLILERISIIEKTIFGGGAEPPPKTRGIL